MKPEPLKGKVFWVDGNVNMPGAGGRYVANRFAIRSAIEWAKKRLHDKGETGIPNTQRIFTYTDIFEVLDKAFEDVMK